MKILSLILFIIIYELSLENPLDDLRHKAYDDAYYSERIKKYYVNQAWTKRN